MERRHRWGIWVGAVAVVALLGWAGAALGAHPLITDDTGTQGEGKFQVEATGEYSHDRENGVVENAFEALTIISYGLWEPVDLVLTVPYHRVRTKEEGRRDTEEGISDLVLEVKWRFWEDEALGLSLAVKPGMTFHTGDHRRGLGVGRPNATLFLIATEEMDPLAIHLNLGYLRNENRVDERRDLWHASLAAELEILEGLKAVANIGIDRNPDRASNTDSAFILGGFIYSVFDWLDLDIGVKGGLTRPEADYTLMAGVAFRF
jgi:hypothetical protein